MKREGISAGGNWIIDTIKIVDTYPEEGNLANILETRPLANGGCPYNVLLDLAKLETGIPLQGIGAIGNDEAGEFILQDCKKHNIDISLLHQKKGVPTSYTDVFNVQKTGRRSFFHARGANALLDVDDFDVDKITGRICLLGYLLLLDSLDAPDSEFGNRAARLLSKLSDAGIETAVDIVSENSDRFARIVLPTLPYVDYLIINEVEASKTVNIDVRDENENILNDRIMQVAEMLVSKGVRKQVIIHYPEGAFSLKKAGNEQVFRPSLDVPEGFIVGATGAGDAFCAGALYGIYESWSTKSVIEFVSGMAAASLSEAASSTGIRPIAEIEKLIKKYP